MFKFKKYRKEYIWENDTVSIVFQNLSYQAFNELSIVKSIDDIMYLYYNVSIYSKGKNYKKIAEVATYDAPALKSLIDLLDSFINSTINIEEDGQKIYQSGRLVGYAYTGEAIGEDWYKIVQTTNSDNMFSVFIGTCVDFYHPFTVGVNVNGLNLDDLKELYKCVTTFIQDGINTINKNIYKHNIIQNKSLEIKDGKLYVYECDVSLIPETDKINKNKIMNIYAVGDKIDSIECFVNKNKDDFKVKEIINPGKIVKIKPDQIVFENHNVNIDDLITIWSFDESKLDFDTKEIAYDFLTILSKEEEKEFLDNDVLYLFEKYSEAIINRTNMYREEHNLKEFFKTHERNVKENVKIVIKIIKRRLENV